MKQDVRDAYQKIIATLDSLVKSYRVLLDQVRREKQHLISIDISELNILNVEKGTLLKKIQQIENTRSIHAKELATLCGLSADSSLLEIAHALSGDMAERLRSIHATLDLLLTRVIDGNNSNAILAESALQCASGVIDDIKQSVGVNVKPTYERQGRIQQSGGKSGNLVSKQV